ncbi:pathogenesis-related protein PRB1-2-like [Syzygium oleosum]|uniref:pathogenesis-related protein PRB1-2-like n=1 Tax=Syzygium oleosum TaxID=219896 RepID=UPI0024BAB886|nr:pathogenesis-related protein PRB1-2-like [Syzygium oleosum]
MSSYFQMNSRTMMRLAISLVCFFVIAATSTTTVEASADKAEMIRQFLDGHNTARKAVGVPPLVWDTSLSTYARVYANKRRADCKLVHSPGYAFGENLFWGQGRQWSAADATAAWVAEKRWYNYASNACSGQECTHYTQVVWRTTTRVGCAKIICNSGDTFIACEYYPPGNYIGQRPYIN